MAAPRDEKKDYPEKVVFFEFFVAPKPRRSPNLFQKTRSNKLPRWQIRLINLEQPNCHLFGPVSDD